MHSTTDQIDTKQLRQFGFLMGGMLIVFFAFLIPWIWGLAYPIWPWLAAAGFGSIAFIRPSALRPIYIAWMKVGAILGWINTRLLLGIVFFLIFVPVGLIMRIFRDPMNRKYDHSGDTYRVESSQPKTENLERPF